MDDEVVTSDDPRLDEEYVREFAGEEGEGDVVLVGVVHDHPSSTYRVRSTVESLRPDVLALEVSPIALPMFQAYAEDGHTPPRFGGEMSAAVQASEDAEVVGIDGPSRQFVVALLRRCISDRPSPATARKVLGGLATVTRQALACRAAATVASLTSLRVGVDEPVEHNCSPTDDPAAQADDEARQVAQVQNCLSLLDRPAWMAVRDDTREACMARNLRALRQEGDVVAVVGIGHLDALAGEL
jgi:pheromone shutdown protein TraB